jgi:hypothetical protein
VPASTINEHVFSQDLKDRPEYQAIVDMANRSPYLVSMLDELYVNGGRMGLGEVGKGTFFDPDINQVSIDPSWIASNTQSINQLKPFVSMLGHEAGHATRPNGAGSLKINPWEQSQTGLLAEGVAITSEYLVAKQLGGGMWSDLSGVNVRGRYDQLANNLNIDVSTLTTADQSPALSSFNQTANQIGANYYATLNPSTAPNLKYDEYYREFRAMANTIGNDVNKIDWSNTQPNHIQLTQNTDGSYQVSAQNLPLNDGTSLSISPPAQFTANSQLIGQPNIVVNPITSIQSPVQNNDQPAHEIQQPQPKAPELSAIALNLNVQVEAKVREYCEQHGQPWNQGMDNTVAALTVAAREAKLNQIEVLSVHEGNIFVAQKDSTGFGYNTAQMNAREAANTPIEQSMERLAGVDQQMLAQQSQQQNNPSQTQGRSGPRMV